MDRPASKGPAKSEETRSRILDAAVELFAKNGFGETTMREIAAHAGVATGAAYYYFASKDAIVLAFYDRARDRMAPEVEEVLAGPRDLAKRLRAIIEIKLNHFAPNRRLLGALAAHTDPEHPLSPFSGETREIRERDIESFHRALDGSRVRLPPDLETHLPRLLWLYQMGIILFWIYDRSPEQRRTKLLLEKSIAIAVRLIRLSAFPLLRPVRRSVTDLIATITE